MNNKFPDGFLWGSATSAYQVDGNSTNSDWWEWEQSGNTEPSGVACDHYNRFREDFALAKELEHNTHRMGLEWSRLEKEENVWDENEWAHCSEVINELIKLEIQPIVTLNHFTIPKWLADKNGWLNDESIDLFVRFAVKAIEKLGNRVEYWIPINEPNILAILAYYYGQWPPCRKNFAEALQVLSNMLKSHIKIYQAMHEYAAKTPGIIKPKVGIAKAVTAFHPCSKFSIKDRICTYNRSKFHNYHFINSSKGAFDFLGLNYYFRQFIHSEGSIRKNPFGEVCSTDHHKDAGPLTDMGWEIYPRGIYEVIKKFSRYKKPIIISENGLATKNDTVRQRFIKEHLEYILKAINEGAPVFGYLHWSLIDNFEWDSGYSKQFGLIEVDLATQKRTMRKSAQYYADIIRRNGL